MIKKRVKRIIELTNEFLQIPSSIGYEYPFLKYLNKKAKNLGYQTELSKSCLLIKAKNKNPKKLFSAHIDRHSLIQNEDGEIEYLAFNLKREIHSKFKYEEIEDIEKEVVNSINMLENIKCQLRDNFFVITDENTKETLLKLERSGRKVFFESVGLRHTKEPIFSYDPKSGKRLNKFFTTRHHISIKDKKVTYDTNKKIKSKDKIFSFDSKIIENKNLISAQIDNVISAAVLFTIMETIPVNQDILFTTREEIGESWKCIKEYYEKNDFVRPKRIDETHEDLEINMNKKIELIVLDTSPYENLDLKQLGFLTLRHGDERGGFDEKVVEDIKKVIKKKKIPYDFKPNDTGNTELGKLTKETRGKINGATLQLPSTNYHTTYETTTKESLSNYYRVIRRLILD